MNAIVALCHFCEAHGPCILFCTQAFHSAYDAQLLMDSVPPDKRIPHGGSCVDNSRPSSRETENNSISSLIHHPPPKTSDQCEACRSVPVDQAGFISYDTKAQISYISGQYPEKPELYSILRQACVRSLNCEVCPGREGPIVFGEDNSCHVLSHTFNLRDFQARGERSLYSFIVVMMDRVFLINSWPFLVKHFRALIDDLQAKADAVYSKEKKEDSSNAHPLKASLTSPGPDHYRCIRTNPKGRSLVELTGDNKVFEYLHRYFVFLLKAGGQRVVECVLEGPPQVMAAMETTGESSAGGSVSGAAAVQLTLDRAVSAPEFHTVQVEDQPCFHSLRHFFKVLGHSDFMELANHILRGNQVIVRGTDVTTVTSIINVLKDLVPASCCRIVGFSESYKESFVCNFLGVTVSVELPPHVVASELHVLLDILPPLGRHYSRQQDDHPPVPATTAGADYPGSQNGGNSDDDLLGSYKLMVYSAQARTSEQKYPVFLQRLSTLLSSDMLSDTLVSKGLTALKEEWMNKVKVLYKFSQMGHLDLPQKHERLTKLLQEILLVGHEDLPILQYWRSALSKEYKTHLMLNERAQ